MLEFLNEGLGLTDAALLANRAGVGAFFALSGWHKLANEERHARLVATLKEDHVPWIEFNQYWVPLVEFVAGGCLVLGVTSVVCAVLLLIVCLVACECEARAKVARFNPIDKLDVLDDYLYLPEVLYIIMLVVVIGAGPGDWRLV